MRDWDLPEPMPRVDDAEARRKRQWKLLSTITLCAVAYSVIHKLLVPFCLKFTTVSMTSYASIDPWVIHSLIFGFVVFKSTAPNPLLHVLSALAILSGIWEVFEVFSGNVVGWMAISHLLSSIPIAMCGIALLTAKEAD